MSGDGQAKEAHLDTQTVTDIVKTVEGLYHLNYEINGDGSDGGGGGGWRGGFSTDSVVLVTDVW